MFRARVGQILKRFLGHLAGAHNEDALVVETLKNPRREIGDRDAGNTDAVAIERRFTGDAAARADCGLESAVRDGTDAADFVRHFVGLFHLRKNLRFAEDHAVETGGDAEQMANDVFAFERHQLAADFFDRHVVEVGQILGQRRRIEIRFRVRSGRVEFDAVTSREEHGLVVGVGYSPSGQGIARLFGREGKPFADRQA